MWKRDNIYEELKQLSPLLATIPNTNLYALKTGYFETFPLELETLLRKEKDYELPFNLGAATNTYFVPTGYFENLSTSILDRVKAAASNSNDGDELLTLAPTLSTLNRQNVYTLPAGYFENLVINIKSSKAKVVVFTAVKSVYKYAVAAVFITIMALGAYLFFGKEQVVAHQGMSVDVSRLSDTEIIEYLKEQSNAEVTASNIIIPDENFDVKDVIKDLTDEELKQFLKEDPEPKQSNES